MRIDVYRSACEECYKVGFHLFFFSDGKLKIRKHCSQLNELKEADFARAGDIAPETIELPEGLLPQFAFSMEPQLRKLGMPTKLDKGIFSL